MKICIHQHLTLIVTEFVNTLAEEKKSAKYDEFFCQWRFFLPTIFLPTIVFTED